ncbi:hypothetical protein N9W11_03655 [Psychrosphaera haliotis]|nr:hypothetical protein [Psychrosphaera haliotis]
MSLKVVNAKEFTKSLFSQLLTHWLAIVAMLYSFSVLLNIIYVNSLFDYFSLNPWEFYESHDVLIGAFMRSKLVISSLFIALVALAVISFLLTLEKKEEGKEDSKHQVMPAITGLVLVTTLTFPVFLTTMKAEEDFYKISFLNKSLVTVELKNKTKIENVKLISSPGKFHIYYSHKTQQVKIVNESEILKISVFDKLSISEQVFNAEFKLRLLSASRDKVRKKDLLDSAYFPKITAK